MLTIDDSALAKVKEIAEIATMAKRKVKESVYKSFERSAMAIIPPPPNPDHQQPLACSPIPLE